jgi:hypothetical protein
MNEKRMKAPDNTGDVSLPPAQTAVWSVKPPAQQRDGSEKRGFGVEKCVDKPSDGRKLAETTSKTQFETMNIRSNGKSRLKWEYTALEPTPTAP